LWHNAIAQRRGDHIRFADDTYGQKREWFYGFVMFVFGVAVLPIYFKLE
jgi:hypothetical protein